jgi:hypothetical protein
MTHYLRLVPPAPTEREAHGEPVVVNEATDGALGPVSAP